MESKEISATYEAALERSKKLRLIYSSTRSDIKCLPATGPQAGST